MGRRKCQIIWAILIFVGSVCCGATKATEKRIFSLDGEWELRGFSPDRSRNYQLKAVVPGQVHADLLAAGIISDPFWRDNAELCQWVENWEWTYTKRFELPVGFDTKKLLLQFDGLDTFADIYVNGKKIGPVGKTTVEDMFLPYEFDITGWLKTKGENYIEVKFYSPEKMVREKAQKKSYPGAFGDPIRAYVRRMQCSFGWDWVHRFVTVGIWRPCRIVSCGEMRIRDLFAYTSSIENNEADLRIQMEAELSNNKQLKTQFELVDPKGKIVWNKTIPFEDNINLQATIHDPDLWWPNGVGEQPLYTLKASIKDGDETIDVRSQKIGIRTVQVEELPDKDNPHGSSMTIVVNNKRIFAKGGNWIPADPFPARITQEKYQLLISQAVEAGINMLRVWGGGIYESPTFWDLCNKYGIMVSQDFMLACGAYPTDDPLFESLLQEEFEANIRLIRNHPALVYWCGDNELGNKSKPSDNWRGKEFHQKVTAPLIARLDPSRTFRITSPTGNDPTTNNSLISGDAHRGAQTRPEIDQEDISQYRQAIAKYASARFLSESTTAGTPPKRSLLKFMDESDLGKSEMFNYHTKDNPYLKGGLTLFGRLERLSQKLYGDHEMDIDRRIRQMEYTQYEFVRLTMEAARLNKFYSSGVLFWMFNDCWPASGWSLVDYYGNRKAAWYAMHSGCKPIIAASRQNGDKLEWFLSSDQMDDRNVSYEIMVQPVSGTPEVLKRGDVVVPANSSLKIGELQIREITKQLGTKALLICRFTSDGITDRSYWTPCLPYEVEYPDVQLRVTEQRDGDSGSVTIHADKWARVVTLDADLDFEDNYFEMIPGETRTIRWKSRNGVFSDDIKVTAWNASVVR